MLAVSVPVLEEGLDAGGSHHQGGEAQEEAGQGQHKALRGECRDMELGHLGV